MATGEQTRAGFVLAGGKSSRMGTDKAFLEFGGQTLLERALAVVAASCERVTIVGDPSKFGSYGTVIADVFPGCGPLGGIHAALVQSTAELNLMVAVDMPFVTAELLAFLFAQAETSNAVITVPRVGKGLQPLCAVYHREFGSVAEEELRAGKYKIDATFAGVSVHVIEESELAAGFPARSFFNVNTPQDWMAAEGEDRPGSQ
ncbi:MAG: molybdenum cofactor guanylyltransferase [Terriglobales bacterium]